jgi:hypothetical protein
MNIFLLIAGVLSAYAVLLLVAMPGILMRPEAKRAKKKTVGPTYWGVYPGCQTEELEELKTIQVSTTKSKEKVVAGSTMYARGRGIKSE